MWKRPIRSAVNLGLDRPRLRALVEVARAAAIAQSGSPDVLPDVLRTHPTATVEDLLATFVHVFVRRPA